MDVKYNSLLLLERTTVGGVIRWMLEEFAQSPVSEDLGGRLAKIVPLDLEPLTCQMRPRDELWLYKTEELDGVVLQKGVALVRNNVIVDHVVMIHF